MKKYWVVICEYVSGVDIIGVKEDFEKAEELYKKQLVQEKTNAKSSGYDCVDEDETSFSAYQEGWYDEGHIDLYIREVDEEEEEK